MTVNQHDAEADLSRSDAIAARWPEGCEPTHEMKADYWHAVGRDLAGSFKTVAGRLVHALAVGSWAFAKAHKAGEKVADLERRLIALERRLESERKGFFYRGTYQDGETYDEGDFVTDHGGLWHCNARTQDRPGTSGAFQLAVKAGRDGRDRRR